MALIDEKQSVKTVIEAPSVGALSKEDVEQLELSAPTFPEGGLQAWATVLGTFLVQFCGFGYTTSFGVYQDFYTRVYLTQPTSSAISWIGSVNALLVISSGLFSGRLYDRGHFHLLLYGGSVGKILGGFERHATGRMAFYGQNFFVAFM